MRSAIAAVCVFCLVGLSSSLPRSGRVTRPTACRVSATARRTSRRRPAHRRRQTRPLRDLELCRLLGFRGGPPPPPPGTPPEATFWNIEAGIKEGLPFQPWAAELRKQRMAVDSKDNPDAACLPLGHMQLHTHSQPRKIVQTADLIVDPLRGQCRHPADLPGWTARAAADRNRGGSAIRAGGGRATRSRRDHEFPGWRLARRERRASDVSRQVDRAIPPPDVRHAGDRCHDRRPEGLHAGLDRPGQSTAAGRYRTDRVRLPREREVRPGGWQVGRVR